MIDSLQTDASNFPTLPAARAQGDFSHGKDGKETMHAQLANPDSRVAGVHSSMNEPATLSHDSVIAYSSIEKAKPINFYVTHELKAIHNGPQMLNRETPDWIFPVLILILASLAWLRAFYNKYFMQILASFFNNNLTNQIVRDENILVQRASVVLNIIFNLVAALLLFLISVHYNWSLAGIGFGLSRYLYFAILVSATYSLKILLLKICGYLFRLEKEMAAYIFNIFLVNNMLGIILVPMVVLLAFSNTIPASWLITGSIIIAGLAFLYRIIRGLATGLTSSVSSLYYLFLYLCTLEFAPLLVLIKILNLK